MSCPRHLIDGLECLLSVYFSNARHNIRAAFLLCDELVEVTCRECAKQKIPKLGRIDFFNLLDHAAVKLHPKTTALGSTLMHTHETRNDMQHNNPAATVDPQHCADAILDLVQALDHCFPASSPALPDMHKVALRVIRLHSSKGDLRQRSAFADEMINHAWRTRKNARQNESVFVPGDRLNWGTVILPEYAQVESILNRVGAP